MPESSYTLKDITLEEEHDFGDSKMNRFAITLEDERGTVTSDIQYWLGTDKDPPTAPATVTAEVGNAKRGGLKASRLQVVSNGASPPPQQAASASRGRAPSGDRERSIERQVALKCASEQAAAMLAAGKPVTAEQVVARAETLDGFLSGATTQPQTDDDIPF